MSSFSRMSSCFRSRNLGDLRETLARTLSLAAEIVSPSSSRHDRVTKRPPYQRHVPEYWVVDLDARLIERWTPPDERPALLTQSLVWRPNGAASSFGLDVPSYFSEIFLER
jgi:Uma2 family endonuclease